MKTKISKPRDNKKYSQDRSRRNVLLDALNTIDGYAFRSAEGRLDKKSIEHNYKILEKFINEAF